MLFLSITTSRSIQVSSLFPPLPEDSAKSAKFSSIGTHFKTSIFENINVLQQLRCGGVMEAIRISMAGFPTSRPFHEFLNRFCIFAPEILDRSHDDITASREILEKVKLQGYQVGKTKVFIRAGQMAELDALRNEILGQSASKIQKRFRTYYFHKWFMGLRQASIQIQAHCRAELACHVFEHRRREVACVIMQKYVRRYIARKSYSVLCISATVIESGMRGMAARKEIYFRKKTKAAIKIQSEGRKYFARYKYMRMRKAAIVTQCACRVKMAKRELRKLRMAAKETGVLQEAKNKLEKEVEELTWRLQLEKRMRADLEETRKKENEKLQVAMQEMQKQFEETKTSLMKERDEALKKATEKPAIQEVAVSDDKVTAENEHLKKSNDNNHLSYWLSNTSTLLFLLQRSLKPPPQPTSFWGRISQSFRSSPSRNLKIDIVRSVEAKMPALLFKQQLAVYVEKIFGIIRDNFKGELSTLLESCIQAPRTMVGSALRQSLSNSPNIPPPSTHWRNITDSLDLFLFTLKENYVPKVLIQKIFTQTFSYINVRLFNSVFLRRECCTFTNGKYVKDGLAELETWCTQVGEEFAGSSWDELKHIKQAVGFLIIRKKSKITYDAITKDLCSVLSIHQIYRICTLYSDDNYNTRSVSSHVISRIREKMSENETESDAFLLDDTLSIPCSVDELSANEEERDFGGVKAAPQLVENPDFQFLQDVAA